jgi:hypothetical protein
LTKGVHLDASSGAANNEYPFQSLARSLNLVKLREVCRHVRSKNAGPFWVTVDLFFDGQENFARYAMSDSLSPNVFESLYGTQAALVKRIPVANLNAVKISYPRPQPQGWLGERDMHQGQSFVRLLDVDLV